MGCPRVYYLRALQCLAYALVYDLDQKLARTLNEQTDITMLEDFINGRRKEISEKEFYYAAGGAAQCVVEEAYQEGTDPFNASIGGINEFEDFIELE